MATNRAFKCILVVTNPPPDYVSLRIAGCLSRVPIHGIQRCRHLGKIAHQYPVSPRMANIQHQSPAIGVGYFFATFD